MEDFLANKTDNTIVPKLNNYTKSTLEEQHLFNLKFMLKFVVFVFLYRNFTTFIDPECKIINSLVNGFEKIYNNLNSEDIDR